MCIKRQRTKRTQTVPQYVFQSFLKIERTRPKVVHGPDRVGLVGFNDYGFIIAKPTDPHSPQLVQSSQQLHQRIGGRGTNLTDALRKGIQLLHNVPRGVLRRMWICTDGYPNRETNSILHVAEQARQAHININTIGFGDQYDADLLRYISGMTHNGRFVPVRTLRQLSDALIRRGGNNYNHRGPHRSETTIIAVDLSASMTLPMNGQRKIDVMEEAVLRLLHYKQQCHS